MRVPILLFFLVSNNVFSSDWSRWKKEDIFAIGWEFVINTKKELLNRALAVEKFSGQQVDLKFLHNANMDRRQQSEHERFLKFKTTERNFHKYIAPYLAELERNRVILAKAEEKASKIWDAKNKDGEISRYVASEVELYGTEIKSSRLGVVLDNSNSMYRVLPKLRDEIKSKFKKAYFIEIYGSKMNYQSQDLSEETWFYVFPEPNENPFLKQWYCQSYPAENAHLFINNFKTNNLPAFTALAKIRKVDSIYWFTDLKDRSDNYNYDMLSNILKKYDVRLYVHTTDRQPPSVLRKIIKESGGEIIKKRV